MHESDKCVCLQLQCSFKCWHACQHSLVQRTELCFSHDAVGITVVPGMLDVNIYTIPYYQGQTSINKPFDTGVSNATVNAVHRESLGNILGTEMHVVR